MVTSFVPDPTLDLLGDAADFDTPADVRQLLLRLPDVLNARAYGATGDGVTDDTVALTAAAAAAAAGAGVLYLGPGVFTLSALTVPAAGLTIRGAGRGLTTLRHKAGATTDMLTTAADLDVADVTLDGNQANQITRVAMVRVLGSGGARVRLRECRLTGATAAVVYATDLAGTLAVEDCEITDMAYCPAGAASYPQVGVAVFVNNNTGPTNAGSVTIRRNRFVNGAFPNDDRMPAAVQIQGADVAAPLTRVDVSDNDVVNWGHQESASAALMLYQFALSARFAGNRLYRVGHSAINLSNSHGGLIAGNIVDTCVGTAPISAIVYSGFSRTPSAVFHDVILADNVVRHWTLEAAFHVAGGTGASEQTRRLILAHNVCFDCASGIDLDGVGETVVDGNVLDTMTLATAAGGGIRLNNITGLVTIRGGSLSTNNYYGVVGAAGLGAAHVLIQGVAFDNGTVAHVRLPGCASVHVADCRFLDAVAPLDVTAATAAWAIDNVAGAAPANLSGTTVRRRGNSWDLLDGSSAPGTFTVNAGATTTKAVTVTGAALGDFVVGVAASVDLGGLEAIGYASAADTVTVVVSNPTAGNITLTTPTLYARVQKR